MKQTLLYPPLASLRYCYVRFQGIARHSALKFFYTDSTSLDAFIRVTRSRGEARSIEFPPQDDAAKDGATPEDLSAAWADGRVVL